MPAVGYKIISQPILSRNTRPWAEPSCDLRPNRQKSMTLAFTTRRPDGARWCNAGSSSTGRTSCLDDMLPLQPIEVVRHCVGVHSVPRFSMLDEFQELSVAQAMQTFDTSWWEIRRKLDAHLSSRTTSILLEGSQ